MVKQIHQIYKCNVCGNMVAVTHVGGGTLICCNQDMELMEEKTQDQGQEKHVPVVEKTETGIKVKVGEVAHPMEEGHYIEWVELITEKKSGRKYFKPGDKPEKEFDCDIEGEYRVRAYCNVHGLWKN
jgi:superoxide reductase